MKKSRFALFQSVIALLLCVSMLAGTTFAWFTDSVSSGTNTIAAGNLDIELEYRDANGTWHEVDESTAVLNNEAKWEPGHTEVAYLRISNAGNLALKYALGVGVLEETGSINVNGEPFYLSDHIRFGIITSKNFVTYGTREEARDALTASQLISQGEISNDDTLKADDKERYVTLVVYMPEEIGNVANHATGVTPPEIKLGIQLTATQAEYESDSFGKNYDSGLTPDVFDFPAKKIAVTASAGVTTDESNKVADEVTLADDKTSAKIPEGVLLDNGTKVLTLEVSTMEQSGANIVLNENEASVSLDVHVDGVSKDNTQPMEITIQEVAPKGLNMGNYKFYHVENGITNEMTLVASDAAFSAHNQFKYDPVTGDITLYMATFSEVALVADTKNAWDGNFDYSWYTNAVAPVDGEAVTEYVIANADQLAAFGAIVGGMNGQTQDSFKDKTVKLIADVNLGDKESENNPNLIFYPIGYNSSDGKYEKTGVAVTTGFYNFCGSFDGNGHTVSNFYQNTWEMKGDNNYYDATLQYYRDGMGLFGKVYGGTVKNLTVSNFSSDGEYTTTGVIAAYADGATFENIAIFNCNPRVYNIGNGGIVGCVGWYAKEANLKTTFKNITVDNSNKISALWGSYDVACGGIVGQYYPTSGQTSAGTPANGGVSFENCHISAQMDVYNDVCGNYQYYAYRYAGMLIGSVRENVTIDGHVYPKMDGITANDCTVHFGTWNDYYYCEFVKNGHPSYSGPDDYKFSRIPHSEINFTDSNGNGIIDTEGERASVTGCKHTHTAAEDQQCVYLQFNNLVTGYGWGVTTKVVGELEGVTILDREVGDSKVKFVKSDTAKVSYMNGKPIQLGELFKAAELDDEKLSILSASVSVTVSPVGEDSTAGGSYVANTTDWAQGTLTLTGNGAATITITDYYFCTPTTIEVTVTERQPEVKFDVVMNNGDFLHRVGNVGTVALDKLFKAKEDVTVGTVSVTVESVDDTGASGNYSNNAIQFSGTGVVKVTITDNDYCTPTELILEVVAATNLTSATGTTNGGNFVLLCDVNTSTYVNYWNCTLYGNGFTYSLKGAPTDYNSKNGHGVLIANGATFDNVVIIGDVYDSYGAYTNQKNYNAAVQATNSIIQNCYIANCATPVRGNDVTIINSTLYGGTVANLILASGTNTLKDVTTVNYNDDRSVLGLGIVVNDEASDNTKIVIQGSLKQYNYVCSSDIIKVPGNEAKALFNSMFSDTFNVFRTGDYVNTGIVIMSESLNTDIITGNVEGYEKLDDATLSLTVSGITKKVNGAVYAPKGEDTAVDNDYSFEDDKHASDMQGAYLPTFEFELGNYYDSNEGESDTRYCYESDDNKAVRLLYQDGQTPFTFDLTKLASVTKFGYSLEATVKCKDSSGAVLATDSSVTLKDAGEYSFEITVNDDIIYGADGTRTGESVSRTYVVNVELSVKKASWKNADIVLTSPTSKSGYNSSKYYVLDFLKAINITDYAEDGTAETVNLKAEYTNCEISYVNTTSYAWGGFTLTITYTDGRVLTVTFGAPSGLSSPGASAGGKTISLKTDSDKGYLLQSDGKINTKVSGTWPITKCTFKGKNTVTVENTDKVDISVDQNTTIKISGGDDGCVTPDTLITLADGSQVRVDRLKGDEQLLVWNLETGKYDTAPIVFVDNEQESEYEIIHLYFSDGSDVKVIYEHGFFDLDLGEYVYIDANNYADYIGHRFVTEGDVKSNNWNVVTLDEVVIETEVTTAWSPVTFEHLCYYTNGVLSMPGGIEGLFNIFEVDTDLMRYDADKMQKDIETFGLFTIEDFGGMITEDAFNAFNGAYLKVAIAKGILTWEDIAYMAERYIPLMK